MQKNGVVIGPDTTTNVIHNIYPEGLKIPDSMMDPNVGGKKKKCRHVYENVGSKVCPDCGQDTREIDFEPTNQILREHYKNGDHEKYICQECGGTIRIWWSI